MDAKDVSQLLDLLKEMLIEQVLEELEAGLDEGEAGMMRRIERVFEDVSVLMEDDHEI
jgi:hypothetical protein